MQTINLLCVCAFSGCLRGMETLQKTLLESDQNPQAKTKANSFRCMDLSLVLCKFGELHV